MELNRNTTRERAAVTAQEARWRADAEGVDVDSLTAADVLTMDVGTYGALALAAMRGARRGRMATADPLSWTRGNVEDVDTALDAIEATYSAALAGRIERSPAGFCYSQGRRFGKRRAIHRIRERGNVIVDEPTDRKVPADAEALTPRELLAAVPPSRRDAFQRAAARWRKAEQKGEHRAMRTDADLRTMRACLGFTSAPGAIPLELAARG